MEKINLKINKNQGITLIALIVTIVVLLILAGVTINSLTGSESAMEKAREAQEKTDIATEKEQFQLSVVNATAESGIDLEYDKLVNQVKNNFGNDAKVDTVTNEKTGDTDYIVRLSNGHSYQAFNNTKVLDVFVPEDNTQSGYDVKVVGYKISLNDEFGLRFYFTIPEEKVLSGNETITLKPANQSLQTINVTKDNLNSEIINGEEYYYVTSPVYMKEMADDITFTAYNNGTQDSQTIACSYKKLGNEVLNNKEKYSIELTANLEYFMKSILYLGGKTQEFFKYNTSNLAGEGIEIDTSYVTSEYLEKYKKINKNDINFYDRLLNTSFGSGFRLQIGYLIPQNELSNYKIKINETLYDFSWNSSLKGGLVTLPNKICNLDKMFEYYIVDSENNIIQGPNYAGLYTYFYSNLNNINSKLHDVAKACVIYNEAFDQYFNNL